MEEEEEELTREYVACSPKREGLLMASLPLCSRNMLLLYLRNILAASLLAKKEVILHLYDTAGQEDYDRLRPLSYQNTSVVLVCYDVMNPTSFDNVLIKWSHEVNHFCQGIPIVLVGCKTDLRKDKEQLRKLRSSQQEPITYNQGEEARRQMNADAYLECSAKYRENIEDVFREAANIALNAMKKNKRQKKSRPCALF